MPDPTAEVVYERCTRGLRPQLRAPGRHSEVLVVSRVPQKKEEGERRTDSGRRWWRRCASPRRRRCTRAARLAGRRRVMGSSGAAHATRKEEGALGGPLAMMSSECRQWLDSGGVQGGGTCTRVERDEGLERGKGRGRGSSLVFKVGERRGRRPIGHQWQGRRRRRRFNLKLRKRGNGRRDLRRRGRGFTAPSIPD
jgi:hypothetical protein